MSRMVAGVVHIIMEKSLFIILEKLLVGIKLIILSKIAKIIQKSLKNYKPMNFHISSEGKPYAIAEEILALEHVQEDLKLFEKLK